MVFKYCNNCSLRYCGVCRACDCSEDCSECGNYRILRKCYNCEKKICDSCSYELPYIGATRDEVLCRDCFENLCDNCGQLDCYCSLCDVCQKEITNFYCFCGKTTICKKCSLISNRCRKCYDSYTYTCPVVFLRYGHKCPECYNVFIDPKIKKNLLTTLLCLSSLPKPLRLMICSLMAEYN